MRRIAQISLLQPEILACLACPNALAYVWELMDVLLAIIQAHVTMVVYNRSHLWVHQRASAWNVEYSNNEIFIVRDVVSKSCTTTPWVVDILTEGGTTPLRPLFISTKYAMYTWLAAKPQFHQVCPSHCCQQCLLLVVLDHVRVLTTKARWAAGCWNPKVHNASEPIEKGA